VSKDAQLSCRKGDKFFGSGFYYSGILNFHNIGDFLYISGNRFSYLVGLHMLYLYLFSTLSLQQTGLFFLSDIVNFSVAFKLSKRKPDDNLQMLHMILFGKKGKVLV
jgi:hypothetical protein